MTDRKAVLTLVAFVAAAVWCTGLGDAVYGAYVYAFKFHCPEGQRQARITIDYGTEFPPPGHKLGDSVLIDACWPPGR